MNAVELKEQAARDFVAELLKRPQATQVGKVMLFGSVAEGRARDDSDVDVVIFGTGDLEELRHDTAQAAFETALKSQQLVEPIVLPLWRLFHPLSHFTAQVLRSGKELYSMSEEDLTRSEVEGRSLLARSYLQVAAEVLANGHYRQAADLAYNAAELIARALLIGRVERMPTSHAGTVTLFGVHVVQEGVAPPQLGSELHECLAIRNRSRYDHTAAVTETEARRVLDVAERLLELVEQQQPEAPETGEN